LKNCFLIWNIFCNIAEIGGNPVELKLRIGRLDIKGSRREVSYEQIGINDDSPTRFCKLSDLEIIREMTVNEKELAIFSARGF